MELCLVCLDVLWLGAPVTDWKLYDTAYTERYMGLVDENATGYDASNVLTYADRFPSEAGMVLVAHGLCDENVFFRHTEVLVEKLIEVGKEVRVQVYPGERHGLRGPAAGLHFEGVMFCWMKELFGRDVGVEN